MAGVRQFDEDEAFAQALDVFWRKGYRATSMIDLADATGVQRGSLYNAYGDKEEIFLRVFDRYTSRFVADARKALDKPDLHDALNAFFDFAIRSILRGSPARGCLSTKTAIETDSESPFGKCSITSPPSCSKPSSPKALPRNSPCRPARPPTSLSR